MSATKTMWIAVAVAAGMMVGFASVAEAGVVYRDTFESGDTGALAGQAPEVRPGTETWAAGSISKYAPSEGDSEYYASPTSNNQAATLPMVFGDGEGEFARNDVYTLTSRIYNQGTGDAWVAVGWHNGDNSGTRRYQDAGVGRYWLLWRGDGRVSSLTSGASIQETVDDVDGELIDGRRALDVQIVLDWTAETPTITWNFKNPSASSWTELDSANINESIVNNVQRVGIGNSTVTNAGWYSFEVTTDADLPPPADPYDDWAGEAAFGDDTSGDGIANGVAWVLGADNPTVDVRNAGLLPTITMDDDELVFAFRRRKAAEADEATEIVVEYSTDLVNPGSWTDAVAGAGIVIGAVDDEDTDFEIVTVTFDKSELGDRLFVRLRVER